MKFYLLYLISVLLLLVPLATAETTAKFLYTYDDNDYMITDGYNVTYMKFGQFKNGLLFQIRIDGNSALLEIDADHFIKTNLSLAVETFRDENRSSSESLKHLLVRTSGKIIARNLTEPERLQLEAFKKRQRGKWNFKVVHKGSHLKSETCGFHSLMVATFQHLDGPGRLSNSFKVGTAEADYGSFSVMELLNKTLPEMSFVIERRPGRERDDCKRDEINGLRVEYCRGQIGLAPLTKDD